MKTYYILFWAYETRDEPDEPQCLIAAVYTNEEFAIKMAKREMTKLKPSRKFLNRRTFIGKATQHQVDKLVKLGVLTAGDPPTINHKF